MTRVYLSPAEASKLIDDQELWIERAAELLAAFVPAESGLAQSTRDVIAEHLASRPVIVTRH